MNQFNTNKWFKNQYLKEANLYESKADLAAKAIDQAIAGVDESLGYSDFAKAVATILKDEYGAHNFNPFMEVLHAELGIEESLNEAEDIPSFLKNLAQELKGKYPELRFSPSNDKIEVIGSNSDKQDFADENLKKDWGNNFVTFDIDDDDRGYMVSITRVNRL
jgi:hypothetical protein